MPMIHKNVLDFGLDCFINSLISQLRGKWYIEVRSKSSMEAFRSQYLEMTYDEVDDENVLYKVGLYAIPERYWNDVEMIRIGKYSKLSIDAVELIQMKSGLTFKKQFVENGVTLYKTSPLLIAISKDHKIRMALRDKMEKAYDINLSKIEKETGQATELYEFPQDELIDMHPLNLW